MSEDERKEAIRVVMRGQEYPYHDAEPKTRGEQAALGVLFNLSDRRGIKNGLEDVDLETRQEIVQTLGQIIDAATAGTSLPVITDYDEVDAWLVKQGIIKRP